LTNLFFYLRKKKTKQNKTKQKHEKLKKCKKK
jgi:hypothetical protein